MSNVSVRGSIKAYSLDESRILVYSQVTRKEVWMNSSDIKAIAYAGLATNLWIDRKIAEDLGLVNGKT